MKRLDNLTPFFGKVLDHVDESAVNCMTFYFTDGSSFFLEAENILPSIGLVGIVPYPSPEIDTNRPDDSITPMQVSQT